MSFVDQAKLNHALYLDSCCEMEEGIKYAAVVNDVTCGKLTNQSTIVYWFYNCTSIFCEQKNHHYASFLALQLFIGFAIVLMKTMGSLHI